MVTEKAYAKINLCLDITGRRPNGYHEVRMIMQTIDLYDTLSLAPCEEGIELITDNEALNEEQKSGSDNLIVKAAKAIFEYKGVSKGVRITLNKQIPIAAGMAGGSSDAAATLRGINRLFDFNLSDEELEKIGVSIGADVPYCVKGGTVLCEGIGEVMSTLSRFGGVSLVIVKPKEGASTKEVYTRFDALDTIMHPNVDEMITAIDNRDLKGVSKLLGNVLEPVTADKISLISEIEKAMLESGAINAAMSGSGPTVFGIYEDEASARNASLKLKDKYTDLFVLATSTV